MDVDGIFEEDPALLFLLLVLIVLFELEGGQEGLFEGLEELDVHDEDRIPCLLFGRVVIVNVHVLEDVEGSGPEWFVDVEVDFCELVGFVWIGVGLLLRKVMNWKR